MDACFCGHYHHTLYNEYKGTRIFVAGSTGTCFDNTVSGFNVVSVGKDGVDVRWVETEGE